MIDECEFTDFIYENYDEETADQLSSLIANCFDGDHVTIKRSNETDQLSVSINKFLDSRPDLGDIVEMIFTN